MRRNFVIILVVGLAYGFICPLTSLLLGHWTVIEVCFLASMVYYPDVLGLDSPIARSPTPGVDLTTSVVYNTAADSDVLRQSLCPLKWIADLTCLMVEALPLPRSISAAAARSEAARRRQGAAGEAEDCYRRDALVCRVPTPSSNTLCQRTRCTVCRRWHDSVNPTRHQKS